MNEADVSSAVSVVMRLMPKWFESASNREAEGWESRIGCLKIDVGLRWDEMPEEYVPVHPQEYKMERRKFEASKKQYAKQLAELQERERRFQEIDAEINRALPTLSQFAHKLNIDFDPLVRLFELKKLEAHEDAVLTLRRIEVILKMDRKGEEESQDRTGRPRMGKINQKPSEQLSPEGKRLAEKHVSAALGREDKAGMGEKHPSEDEHPPTGNNSPLVPEEAAILKVLLQSHGVTMTVEKIEGKVTLSNKTIRKHLTSLHERKLVEEPAKKKGHCLTETGRRRASELPVDAGTGLLRPGR